MNYRHVYMAIISHAKSEVELGLRPKNKKQRNKYDEHYEFHHILPKSLFPNWQTKPSNLVPLTLREHFFCHQLLTKIYPTSKMYYALWRFMNGNKQQKIVSSRQYEKIKLYIYKNCSSPRKGAKCTPEQRLKFSEAQRKYRLNHPEYTEKISKTLKNFKNRPDEKLAQSRRAKSIWDNRDTETLKSVKTAMSEGIQKSIICHGSRKWKENGEYIQSKSSTNVWLLNNHTMYNIIDAARMFDIKSDNDLKNYIKKILDCTINDSYIFYKNTKYFWSTEDKYLDLNLLHVKPLYICLETKEILSSKEAYTKYKARPFNTDILSKDKQVIASGTDDNNNQLHWSQYDENFDYTELFIKYSQKPRKVLCVETSEIFINAKYCAKKYGSNIHKVLRGERQQHLGLHFKYI